MHWQRWLNIQENIRMLLHTKYVMWVMQFSRGQSGSNDEARQLRPRSRRGKADAGYSRPRGGSQKTMPTLYWLRLYAKVYVILYNNAITFFNIYTLIQILPTAERSETQIWSNKNEWFDSGIVTYWFRISDVSKRKVDRGHSIETEAKLPNQNVEARPIRLLQAALSVAASRLPQGLPPLMPRGITSASSHTWVTKCHRPIVLSPKWDYPQRIIIIIILFTISQWCKSPGRCLALRQPRGSKSDASASPRRFDASPRSCLGLNVYDLYVTLRYHYS